MAAYDHRNLHPAALEAQAPWQYRTFLKLVNPERYELNEIRLLLRSQFGGVASPNVSAGCEFDPSNWVVGDFFL